VSSSSSATATWNRHSRRSFKLDFIVVGLASQLVGTLITNGFVIDPGSSYRSGIRAAIPESASSERLLVETDNDNNTIIVTVETSRAVVDETDYGCETLDKACDAIQSRLQQYSGLKCQTYFVCPECLHKNVTSTSMNEEELSKGKHDRPSDGVVCVTCSNNHDVAVFKWKGDFKQTLCQQHSSTHHDYFISYRVKTEGGRGNNLSNDLCDELELAGKGNVVVYLDHRCLQVGINWKDGFLFGIGHSDVLVITLSKGSIDIINDNAANKNHNNDNVLLEIIRAMEYFLFLFLSFKYVFLLCFDLSFFLSF
jgi:hypothetical protein